MRCHGTAIVIDGSAGRVVVTGGVKPGHQKSESSAARAYLVSKGIAAARILEENRSGSTAGNFTYGLPIAEAAGAKSVTVVSDFSHMRRCLALAYAANQKLQSGLPITGAAWYKDGTTQDATVAQAAEQARAVWSGMTTAIVQSLDAKWGITKPPGKPSTPATIRRGSTGADVRKLQALLGIAVDGIFGPQTEAAVRRYQKAHKLTVDGVVGPKTWNSLIK